MATLLHVNVRTELNKRLQAIDARLRILNNSKRDIEVKTVEKINKILEKEGYSTVNSYGGDICLDRKLMIINLNQVSTKTQSSKQLKLEGIRANCCTQEALKNIEYIDDDVQKYVEEVNTLTNQKEGIQNNLNLATKEYVKSTIIASLLSSADKGEEFVKNISNMAIQIIESLKKDSAPLIAISN
jgi:hypothetical protein